MEGVEQKKSKRSSRLSARLQHIEKVASLLKRLFVFAFGGSGSVSGVCLMD